MKYLFDIFRFKEALIQSARADFRCEDAPWDLFRGSLNIDACPDCSPAVENPAGYFKYGVVLREKFKKTHKENSVDRYNS